MGGEGEHGLEIGIGDGDVAAALISAAARVRTTCDGNCIDGCGNGVGEVNVSDGDRARIR